MWFCLLWMQTEVRWPFENPNCCKNKFTQNSQFNQHIVIDVLKGGRKDQNKLGFRLHKAIKTGYVNIGSLGVIWMKVEGDI